MTVRTWSNGARAVAVVHCSTDLCDRFPVGAMDWLPGRALAPA